MGVVSRERLFAGVVVLFVLGTGFRGVRFEASGGLLFGIFVYNSYLVLFLSGLFILIRSFYIWFRFGFYSRVLRGRCCFFLFWIRVV